MRVLYCMDWVTCCASWNNYCELLLNTHLYRLLPSDKRILILFYYLKWNQMIVTWCRNIKNPIPPSIPVFCFHSSYSHSAYPSINQYSVFYMLNIPLFSSWNVGPRSRADDLQCFPIRAVNYPPSGFPSDYTCGWTGGTVGQRSLLLYFLLINFILFFIWICPIVSL